MLFALYLEHLQRQKDDKVHYVRHYDDAKMAYLNMLMIVFTG